MRKHIVLASLLSALFAAGCVGATDTHQTDNGNTAALGNDNTGGSGNDTAQPATRANITGHLLIHDLTSDATYPHANVVVYLSHPDGTVVFGNGPPLATTSSWDGWFMFAAVPVGDYRVYEASTELAELSVVDADVDIGYLIDLED